MQNIQSVKIKKKKKRSKEEKKRKKKTQNPRMCNEIICLENIKQYMLALGRRMTKHEDGAFIGYGDVVANNVVIDPVVLFDCKLALKLQAADFDDVTYDANDDVIGEFDEFIDLSKICPS